MAATDRHDDRAALPALPTGWRHAGAVEFIARQPRERRETLLAGAFAMAAALWAPLGVLAFLTRNALLFGLLSLVAAVVAVAPRPVTSSVTSALAGLRPALASAREHAAPLVARLRRWGLRGLHGLREVARRAAPRVQAVANWIAARVRAADQRISAAVRSGLEDLRASGGRDHSTPSSAR